MTVSLTRSGGSFHCDDKTRLDHYAYVRQLSQQWLALEKVLGKPMKHLDLLRFIQSMKPSIPAYNELSLAYRRVSFDHQTTIDSQPVVDDMGKAKHQIIVEVTVKGGQAQAKLPATIDMSMPVARAGQEYSFQLDVDPALDTSKQITFTLIFAAKDMIFDTMLTDEAKELREACDELEDLLVIENY